MKILIMILLVIIVSSELTILCDDVLRIQANSQYTYTLQAKGGQGPYQFTATGLPSGVSLNGNTISGLSAVDGVFPVVITVVDGNKGTSNKHIFIYVTTPTGNNGQSLGSTTVTTTTTESGSSYLNGQSSFLPINSGISLSSSSSLTGSGVNFAITDSDPFNLVRNPQTSLPSNYPNQFMVSVQQNGASPQTDNNIPNLNFNSPNVPANSGIVVVPTTTPYITNYSFASTLQNSPVVSTQSTQSAFQRQANINRQISNLLTQIQTYNATLLGLQSNIPNTTALLNDAIRNQRIAQAQVNSIVNQNNSLTTNISGVQTGIKTLQDQIFTTTNTINNSQAQIQNFQTRITQNYLQINTTQNKLRETNNSLQAAISRQENAANIINNSRNTIVQLTQKITLTQNDINNAPSHLARLGKSLDNQKAVILALQKQLKEAILALVPIQTQVDYYTMIPVVGPGLIQQNKTLLLNENSNLAKVQPIYDSSGNDIQTYTDLIKQLTSGMNSLQNQLSADQLAYDNLMGSQNNQEGLFNNTLITIAAQTQLLNKMKEQQNNLITGPYNAALQVASDTTSKVNQLTQTLDSLNKRYQSVQNQLTETQRNLNQALRQKDIADQAVNQVIQSGGGSLLGSTLSSSSSGNLIANITITGS